MSSKNHTEKTGASLDPPIIFQGEGSFAWESNLAFSEANPDRTHWVLPFDEEQHGEWEGPDGPGERLFLTSFDWCRLFQGRYTEYRFDSYICLAPEPVENTEEMVRLLGNVRRFGDRKKGKAEDGVSVPAPPWRTHWIEPWWRSSHTRGRDTTYNDWEGPEGPGNRLQIKSWSDGYAQILIPWDQPVPEDTDANAEALLVEYKSQERPTWEVQTEARQASFDANMPEAVLLEDWQRLTANLKDGDDEPWRSSYMFRRWQSDREPWLGRNDDGASYYDRKVIVETYIDGQDKRCLIYHYLIVPEKSRVRPPRWEVPEGLVA